MGKLLLLANDESTIYNFRREVVSAFVEEKHEVYLAYPLGEHTKQIRDLGCEIIPVKLSRHGTSIVADFRFCIECIKLIRHIKPDVVLTYTVKPNVYGSIACQLTDTKYINNVTGLGSMLQNDGIMARFILWLQKIGLRKSQCVFFQNEDNYKNFLKNNAIKDKTHCRVLPGSGVNLNLHCFEEYPSERNKNRFVIVSRIREDKGFNEFFRAAKNVKEKYPESEFHVVGWYEDDDYKRIIDSLVSDRIIIYHGKKDQTEVHQIIKECHCLVHPSYHEGMANVILEASASGRPVIASDIHGCIEGIEDGITGFTFKVKNAKDLESCMKKFIQLPYEQKSEMGRKARIKMEREFDRNFVIDAYKEEINKVISQG